MRGKHGVSCSPAQVSHVPSPYSAAGTYIVCRPGCEILLSRIYAVVTRELHLAQTSYGAWGSG